MRWKLLIITSLVAALLSAAGMCALGYLTESRGWPPSARSGLFAALTGILLLLSTLAAVFVYRHTARRRKLQATLTGLLSLILTIILLVITAQIMTGRASEVRALPTIIETRGRL